MFFEQSAFSLILSDLIFQFSDRMFELNIINI